MWRTGLWRIWRPGKRARHFMGNNDRPATTRSSPNQVSNGPSATALVGCRPAQVLVQKCEGALAVDAVRALEELDFRPVGQPELRVEEPDLGILVRHPLIAAHQVEVAALDHEGAWHHEVGQLR